MYGGHELEAGVQALAGFGRGLEVADTEGYVEGERCGVEGWCLEGEGQDW